ncbi:MAG: group II intron maturase-specific domain-containing protein [Acidobacteriota bacterium]|nr:group II intron maturase-specific domain-containing protein [Acidobacteriota bacterium]
MSGKIWERDGRRVYFLQRWPSKRSMKRLRARIRELTGRHRNGVKDVRVLIDDLNPVLRGWGNYFRTGNASTRFVEIDRHVAWRLKRFEMKRRGRNLKAGQAERWTPEYFEALGLHRLRGTIRYPERAFWETA